MDTSLDSLIVQIKSNMGVASYNEASIKQAVVVPLLQKLGWNLTDVEEVTPEFSVGERRVDYSLNINQVSKVFVEVKKPSERLGSHEEQLLAYAFRQGVTLAALTNGSTWWLYLPMREGSWTARRFYTLDILAHDPTESSKRLIELLSKQSVSSGKALKNAEEIHQGKIRDRAVAEAFPKAWNKMVSEPDEYLVEALAETVESLSGFRPGDDELARFLGDHRFDFTTSEPVTRPIEINQSPDDGQKQRVSQQKLVVHILRSLRNLGGRAAKKQVEEAIYEKFAEIFEHPYYNESVSHGVPRWRHNIAWANQSAKTQGLVKPPSESGRGYWELTPKGWAKSKS